MPAVHGDLARLVCDKLWRVLVGPYLLEPVLDHARIMALPSGDDQTCICACMCGAVRIAWTMLQGLCLLLGSLSLLL